jgi:hypothetical protein
MDIEVNLDGAVNHYQVNGKYKIQFERSAVKGVNGFKVEANGDNIESVQNDAEILKQFAESKTANPPAAANA